MAALITDDASMKALLEEYTHLSDAPFPSAEERKRKAELKAEIEKYDRLITKHKGESPDWGSLSRLTPRRAGESKKTSLLSLVPPPRPVETKPEPRRDPDAASRKGGWWGEEGPFTGRDGRGVFCARPHGFGIPFGGIPVGGIPVGGIPVGGIPVGGIPLGEYGRPSGRGGHHLLEVDTNGWYL